MNLQIEIGGQVHDVVVHREGSRYRVEADGRTDLVDVARVDKGTLSLILLGDRESSHEVGLLAGREPGELDVYLRAGIVRTRVRGAGSQRRAGASPASGADGPQRVVAPMPGKVVKVLVAPGDEVVPRQGLVVIEAMKMENELRAVRAGTVLEVHVADGTPVEAGRLLVVIG
jgi:biotin carboxyl carrier protein